jgi:hypothetical protein
MARQMSVKDAYAAAKKQTGGTLNKGSKRAQQVKREAKSQNPSGRNKVGAKPKNKKGPWDDVARFGKGFVKQGAKTAKSVKDVAYSVLGGKEAERIARGKGTKSDYAWTALNILPVGKVAGAAEKAAVSGVRAVAENVAESLAKTATQKGSKAVAGKTAKKAVKAADKATTKAVGKPAAKAAKKAAAKKAAAPKVSVAVESAHNELAAIRKAKANFKGQKVSNGKASADWADLLRKERNAQYKVNTALKTEQRTGKAAENMKKIGKTEPKRVDLSEGQTITKNKGIQEPAKPRAYSKVKGGRRDRSGNAPLEKNQRYTYEADPMKRAEGKDRFWSKEDERMLAKKNRSSRNRDIQAKKNALTQKERVLKNWQEVKAKAQGGGPKAQARMERFKKFWNDQGFNLK